MFASDPRGATRIRVFVKDVPHYRQRRCIDAPVCDYSKRRRMSRARHFVRSRHDYYSAFVRALFVGRAGTSGVVFRNAAAIFMRFTDLPRLVIS